jgi:hypothetical protein
MRIEVGTAEELQAKEARILCGGVGLEKWSHPR